MHLAKAAGQYSTLLDLKKPVAETELSELWKNATAGDKTTFIHDNLENVHDRKFLSTVLSKFVVPDKNIHNQDKMHFCLECAKEFGAQFVRNNLAAFNALGKDAQGPWKRELDSVLSKAGILNTKPAAEKTFTYNAPNLTDRDIKTLFKMVPRNLKDALENSTGETADYWFDAIETALSKEEKKRTDYLRQHLRRGMFVDMRWGDDSLFDPGKTYLAVAVDDRPSGNLLKVFTAKGIQRIPMQWVKYIWPATLLNPIKDWNKLKPKVPDAHPVNSDHWRKRFKDGAIVPLHDSVKASSQDLVSWQKSMQPLIQILDELSEDQLLACAAMMRQKIQKDADKRSDQFHRLIPGTWIECRELGRAAYLGKADNGKARVWLPDEDAIIEGEPSEFQKAIYRIPYSWIEKTLSEQALRLDDKGYPDHADLLKHSNEFRRHHHGQQRQDLVKGLETRSLRKLTAADALLDWTQFWNEFGTMQSQIIKKRGDQLVQDFLKFTSSDPALKGTSGKDYLKYQKLHPLKVIFTTDLIQDGQHLGSFVRAQFNLLEGTTVTKDQDIQKVFRE